MIHLRTFDLHNSCDLVASIFRGSSTMEQFFVRAAVIQENIAIMEFISCAVNGNGHILTNSTKVI